MAASVSGPLVAAHVGLVSPGETLSAAVAKWCRWDKVCQIRKGPLEFLEMHRRSRKKGFSTRIWGGCTRELFNPARKGEREGREGREGRRETKQNHRDTHRDRRYITYVSEIRRLAGIYISLNQIQRKLPNKADGGESQHVHLHY